MVDGILGAPQNPVKRTAGARSARGIRSSKVEPKWGYPRLGGGVPRRISAGKKPGATFRAGALRRAQFVPPARHGSGGTNWSTRVPPDLSIPMAPGARSPVFAVALPNSTVFGSFGKNAYFFFWRRAPPQKTTRGGPGGAEPPRLNGSAQRRIPGGCSPDPSLPRARPESPYGSVKVDRDIRCNSARARAGAELQRISRALAQKSAHVRFFQNAPWRVDGIPGGGFHG